MQCQSQSVSDAADAVDKDSLHELARLQAKELRKQAAESKKDLAKQAQVVWGASHLRAVLAARLKDCEAAASSSISSSKLSLALERLAAFLGLARAFAGADWAPLACLRLLLASAAQKRAR